MDWTTRDARRVSHRLGWGAGNQRTGAARIETRRPRGPRDSLRAWGGILLLSSLAPACTGGDSEGACETGSDPMPTWGLRPTGCGPQPCPEPRQLHASGDATVVEVVTDGAGAYDIEVYFIEDATSVIFSVQLPDTTPLAITEGTAVVSQVSIESPWWTERNGWILEPDGRPLLSMTASSLHVSPLPPPCKEEHFCGRIGYPTAQICHPDHEADPAAPCVSLRQGEAAELTYGGTTYKHYVRRYNVYTRLDCSDTPQGWREWLTVRFQ